LQNYTPPHNTPQNASMKVTLLPLALLFALASANGGIDEGQFCNKKTEGMVRCYQAEGPYKPKGRGSHDIGRRPKKGTKMKKCIDKHWVMAADCPSETFCQDFNRK
jgi:hypothetical protein